MNIDSTFPSTYLKAADLQGRPVRVIMRNVVMETVGTDQKPILYFEGKTKGLVVNKTNATTIAYAYGKDTDDWAGGEIELFMAMVDFQGRTVEAIRVRVPPRKPAQQQSRQQAPAQQQRQPAMASAGPFDDEPPPHDGRDILDDEIPF